MSPGTVRFPWRMIGALLLSSAVAKLLYVFAGTAYNEYLYDDAHHYFSRALWLLAGQPPTHEDWDIFPPANSAALALWWWLVDRFGLGHAHLETALILNVAATTLTAALLAQLTWSLSQNRAQTIAVTAAYAFYFPLIFLNAFVISEHPAQLTFLASLAALLQSRHERALPWLAAAGALWALACHFRGAYLLCALPALLFVLRTATQGRALALASYLAGAAAILLISTTLLTTAAGRTDARPLAANGGFNFLMQQCHYHGAVSEQADYRWSFVPAFYAHEPELGMFRTAVPVTDQEFYYRAGWRCLVEQPGSLRRLAAIVPTMFYSQFFPDVSTALGYQTLMPWMRHVNVLLLLLAPAGFLALRARDRPAAGLLAGALLALLVTYALFNADHRHVYSLMPPLLLIAATGLQDLIRGQRQRARQAVLIAVLGAASGVALFGPSGPWNAYAPHPETIPAARLASTVADGTANTALTTLRFWAPLTIELGRLQNAPQLAISLDADDRYRLEFLRGGAHLASVELALAPTSPPLRGLIRRQLRLPPTVTRAGYDQLRLIPVAGPPPYGVAGLCLASSLAQACPPASP